MRNMAVLGSSLQPPTAAKLCERCAKLQAWTHPFRVEDKLSDLEKQSAACAFCDMRWRVCEELHFQISSYVRFDRVGSTIRINGRYPPVFSVCREPGKYLTTYGRDVSAFIAIPM